MASTRSEEPGRTPIDENLLLVLLEVEDSPVSAKSNVARTWAFEYGTAATFGLIKMCEDRCWRLTPEGSIVLHKEFFP